MKLKGFFSFVFALCFLSINGQSSQGDILLTIDNDPVAASEFIRVYNKNLDLVQDESQKDVDHYLTLFTNYKLKLREARALELHKKPTYIRELATYKKQLAKNFVTDTKVTDALIEEAYDRVSHDVNVNHILIRLDQNAGPQDTLKAFNEIDKLRHRTIEEGFEKVRKEVHNGKTVLGEEIGFFSGFKMVYKFENVAFNTPVNEVSMPFRTRFGYHILKVFDKRKSRGERTVAHIMVSHEQNNTLGRDAEVRIRDIYKKLKQGEDFEALAKQFSEDKSSASKGGMLAPISSGQLSSMAFENVVFGLVHVGDISEPVKTNYGWHIIKLYNIKPIPPFRDMKSELEAKVKRDERSKLIDDALIQKLKNHYKVLDNQEALDYFISILNNDYYRRVWKLPADFKGSEILFKVGKKKFTYKDFGDFIIKSQRRIEPKAPFDKVVSKKYSAFLSQNLVKYQEENLEFENLEFANIVNEYRDGLLLFDLMEKTIWNTAKKDSASIRNFYEENKDNYILPERIEAIVASSSKQKILKRVSKLLNQGVGLNDIKKLVNRDDKVEVIFTSEIMDATHQALPEQFEFKKGISKIYKYNDAFVVAQVKDVLPVTKKTFEQAKGIVIADYQVHKEKSWLKALKAKYKVEINQDALKRVKNQIKNQ